MQSSITAWLKKPSSITQPPPSKPTSTSPSTAQDTTTVELPTPPPEEPQRAPSAPSSTSLSFAKPQLQPLTPNISLAPCTQQHLPAFKHLNALLLQIPYPQSFYTEILTDSTTSAITLLAIWRDDPLSSAPGKVVGGIRCRLLSSSTLNPANTTTSGPEKPLLYISTLTVFSAYRHFGIATHLLERVMRVGIQEFGVGQVGAHVWVNNDEGREWYAKRGFKELRVEDSYYRRLKPQGAVVVKRTIGVGDLLGK